MANDLNQLSLAKRLFTMRQLNRIRLCTDSVRAHARGLSPVEEALAGIVLPLAACTLVAPGTARVVIDDIVHVISENEPTVITNQTRDKMHYVYSRLRRLRDNTNRNAARHLSDEMLMEYAAEVLAEAATFLACLVDGRDWNADEQPDVKQLPTLSQIRNGWSMAFA